MERQYALMAISLPLQSLREWFNVSQSMTDEQLVMTAELILDNDTDGWHDLSLAEIKHVCQKMMKSADLYGRLDGNVIFKALNEYFSTRGSGICDTRMQADRDEQNRAAQTAPDPEAAKRIDAIVRECFKQSGGKKQLTPEEQHAKDVEFFKYKTQYLKSKGIIK